VKKKNRFTFLSLKEEKENECEGEEKKMEKWNEEIKIKK